VLCILVLFYTEKYTNELRQGNVPLYVVAQCVSLDVGFGLQPVLGLTGLLQCDSLLKKQ